MSQVRGAGDSLTVAEIAERATWEPGFGYMKINHGYWDHLGAVMASEFWPITDETAAKADAMSPWEGMFQSRLHDGLRERFARYDLLSNPVKVYVSLIAFRGATSLQSGRSFDALKSVTDMPISDPDSTLMKTAAEEGSVWSLLLAGAEAAKVVIGPSYLSRVLDYLPKSTTTHIEIAEWHACKSIEATQRKLVSVLEEANGNATVYCQAGPLSVYWALGLQGQFPEVRWLDLGLALSVINLDSVCLLPWFRSRALELITTSLTGPGAARGDVPIDEEHLKRVTSGVASLLSQETLSPESLERLADETEHLPIALPTVLALAARRALEAGSEDLALRLALRANANAAPGSSRPLVTVAHVLEDLGHLDRALEISRSARSKARNEPAPALAEARLLMRLGARREASDVLDAVAACFDIPVRKVVSAQAAVRAGRVPIR